VGGKLKNGLHNIQANNMLLELHDDIRIKPIIKKKDKIIFKGKFAKHVSKKENTVIKTLLILRKYNLISQGKKYQIVVNKKIPVFAGLGGGTSNSAFIVKYFLKNKIDRGLMSIFVKNIGSDFRLFFFKNSYQKNLSSLKEFYKKYKLHFVLVYPNIKCSTKEVYSKVKDFRPSLKSDPTRILSKKKYIEFVKGEKNSLQKIVENKHKKIEKLLNLIKQQKDCYFSRMTGSGSTCYGIFSSKKKASDALKIIRKKLPNFWCVTSRTI
tara:strand:+ start:976 stop:1776 length:801 start_codon:yes stop_codon:yes gene_type:complete